jgi:hypothetical protein
MKTYRFSELSHSSQIKAVYDYIIGWEETHDENDIFFNEIYDILLDNNEEYEYKQDGSLIEEQ